MNSTEKSSFKVGDAVVYPMQGVGCILARETRREREYYRVQITASDMDVLLPVDNASALGLRHLASITEAKKALSSLSEKRESRGMDWKQRLLMNQELMKEGTLSSVAKVVNSLYRRSKVKELPVQERKLYDNALAILVDESSSVLGIGTEEMKKKIFAKLEK
ncbi:MAG: CarD family transcriptional regulator [Spirochaetes bacterium]|uniref:CarD family transcriptional regulator n=1 Tax=Candidatus Ornithospirochaeta stercoripullorum TaxID=2840899 RepID=A0A9D9DZJ3_9SPIO|nr:CarD family transcriptional regulator [Candidatus Ornithospirochaeta stercoripullorum]